MVDANLIPPALEASCQSTSKLFLSPIYLLTEIFEFFTLPIIIDSPLFSCPYLCISQLRQNLASQCGLSLYQLQNPEELLQLPSM